MHSICPVSWSIEHCLWIKWQTQHRNSQQRSLVQASTLRTLLAKYFITWFKTGPASKLSRVHRSRAVLGWPIVVKYFFGMLYEKKIKLLQETIISPDFFRCWVSFVHFHSGSKKGGLVQVVRRRGSSLLQRCSEFKFVWLSEAILLSNVASLGLCWVKLHRANPVISRAALILVWCCACHLAKPALLF